MQKPRPTHGEWSFQDQRADRGKSHAAIADEVAGVAPRSRSWNRTLTGWTSCLSLAIARLRRTGYWLLRRAVTSISIFMRGSASPAWIIVAAGRTFPKCSFSTGQHGSKSSRFGNI